MAMTYANTQNNPQQNPVYQAQQQIVQTQRPTGPVKSGQADAGETFLQRQQRKYGASSQMDQTHNYGAPKNLQAPQSSTSPVTPNGRLNTAQATAATTPGVNVAPPLQAAQQPAQTTRIDHRTYQGVNFDTLQPGAPVADKPGWTWQHDGQGWIQTTGQGGSAGPAPAAPQLDAFGQPTQFPGLPQMPQNATYFADDLGNTPFSTYNAYQFNQQGMPTYNPGQINVDMGQGYQPGQISQFQGPNQQAIQGSTEALIQQILGNPLSMSDQNVNALKEQQKEQALQVQQQMQAQAAQSAASRGLAPGSGFLATQDRRAGDATQASLLGSYRDIDLAKMVQDQQDRAAAAQLGDQYLSSQMGRATQGYQATLAGQQLREQTGQAASEDARLRAALGADVQGRNLDELFRGYQSQASGREFDFAREQAQAGEGYKGYQSNLTAQQGALERAIAQAGLNQKAADSGLQGFQSMLDAYNQQQGRTIDNRQLDIQQQLGQGGLDLDRAKLGETGRQFDKGYQLDYLNYLLNRDQMGQQGQQFTDQMGLNWAQLNSDNYLRSLGLIQ